MAVGALAALFLFKVPFPIIVLAAGLIGWTQRDRWGEPAAEAPITKKFSEDELKKITLKKPAEYKVVGQWIQRLDIPEKTNGRAKFGIDSFAKIMVYAKTAYPPSREGGKHTAVVDSQGNIYLWAEQRFVGVT